MTDKATKQEACQLFIEQEIEQGLATGKTKYAIGKEIAEWIEKLFGAEVKPNTITQRAHRFEENLVTNVTSFDPENLTEPQKQIIKLYEEGKKDTKIQRQKEIQKNRDAIKVEAEAIKINDRWKVEQADINTWKAPRQYDFIITDPPYKKEFLPLYEVLSQRAVEWLKPDGLLIAMCGQSYLNRIYSMFDKHLDYYWTGCYLTPGQPTPLRQVNVNTTWKPLLIYRNEKYSGKIFGDVFKSDGNDKSLHEWGQSISGMSDIINKICLPGQYILDPFVGAGTTGIAAIRHGCFFDGIDIDIENVKICNGRLNDETA